MLRRLRDKKGQNTLEYVLMLGFVAAIIVLFFTLFRDPFENMVKGVTSKIQDAIGQIQ
jgi:Flp pilus assembly pilin Flp